MPIVKFRLNYSPYNAGETAGFDDATCERLIGRGVAAYLVTDTPAVMKDAPQITTATAGADAAGAPDDLDDVDADAGDDKGSRRGRRRG
jgi:hypothetical protein